ncbi:hypothetical protein CGT98_12845 [Vibrio metoecus]|uniref:Uncharacterized protein n=1 Tax=Vibrio metoecus TaxID=1481663 RepID=A0A271VQH7_VIBMT|nr:hypothetical protein CGU03_12310 [Vibrio metoecus]PAR23319.1 hypothetical protein CGU02_15295 [Vibrio metoecus]PAR37445.1 hypothetical protein CGT97_02210 [Vibrio metoecus]PAR38648.1 hypothetical protein CGT98_12845 [Vibrio metoecus]PAR42571.1 hypothetical protein CGT96_11625 [Vibrio metoecus]
MTFHDFLHNFYIPFLLEAAGVLATFVHPNHIVYLCSWGLTHLPPTCNSKLFGYSDLWLKVSKALGNTNSSARKKRRLTALSD